MIQPLHDRVLIQRIEEESLVALTDAPKSIKGVVLSTGPGKWIEGDWWPVQRWKYGIDEDDTYPSTRQGNVLELTWEWIPGYRQPLDVKPGDKVLFNSKWNDFSAGENKGTGSDGSGPLERPLPLKADPLIHLIQEADIFAIVPDFNFRASIGKPTLEREYFVNRQLA